MGLLKRKQKRIRCRWIPWKGCIQDCQSANTRNGNSIPLPCATAPLSCCPAPRPCSHAPLPCNSVPLPCATVPLPCRPTPLPCSTDPLPCILTPLHEGKQAPLPCNSLPLPCAMPPLLEPSEYNTWSAIECLEPHIPHVEESLASCGEHKHGKAM